MQKRKRCQSKPLTESGLVCSGWGPEAVNRAFDELGLDVFEFDHACTSAASNQSVNTRVVTGILRAPKSDGKECFVWVVEYDSKVAAAPSNAESLSGLSVALLLAQVLNSTSRLCLRLCAGHVRVECGRV